MDKHQQLDSSLTLIASGLMALSEEEMMVQKEGAGCSDAMTIANTVPVTVSHTYEGQDCSPSNVEDFMIKKNSNDASTAQQQQQKRRRSISMHDESSARIMMLMIPDDAEELLLSKPHYRPRLTSELSPQHKTMLEQLIKNDATSTTKPTRSLSDDRLTSFGISLQELLDIKMATQSMLTPAMRAAGIGERNIGTYSPLARRKRIARFLEKRKRRTWAKKVDYGVRKNFADSRLRVKGRFVKKEDEELLCKLLSLT